MRRTILVLAIFSTFPQVGCTWIERQYFGVIAVQSPQPPVTQKPTSDSVLDDKEPTDGR